MKIKNIQDFSNEIKFVKFFLVIQHFHLSYLHQELKFGAVDDHHPHCLDQAD